MAFLEYKTNLTAWFEADFLGVACPQDMGAISALNQSGLDVSGIDTNLFGDNSTSGLAGMAFGIERLNGRPVWSSIPGTSAGWVGNLGTAPLSSYMTTIAKTIFVVCKVNTIATNNVSYDNPGLFQGNSSASDTTALQVRNSTPPTIVAMNFGGAVGTAPFTLGQWGIAILKHDGFNISAGWNDEDLTLGAASGANNVSYLSVVGAGGIAPTYRGLDGSIAAILIYKEAMLVGNMAKVMNYLRAKWLSPNNTIASPGMRGDALEQARDVASRRLWFERQPLPMGTAKAPLWVALDADVLADIAVASPLGPSAHADGTGWKNSRPERRRMRLYTSTIDLDNLGSAELTLGDLRGVNHAYQETALAIRASSLQRQGIANSGAVRSFSRGFASWIVDPSSLAVVKIDASAEKVASGGLLLEDGARNYILRSAFISGLTGIGSSGTAAGATIALDTAPPSGFLFDSTVTANSLKFAFTLSGTSGSSSVRFVAGHPTFTPPFDLNVLMFNIDHIEDTIPSGSSGFGFSITRSSDSFAWDVATNVWSSTKGAVLNPIPLSTAAISRYSVPIAFATTTGGSVFTAGSSYLLQYGFASGIGSSHTAHVFQAELVGAMVPTSSLGGSGSGPATAFAIEPWFATSRIVTDAQVADRTADLLRYFSIGYGVLPPSVGTFRFKFAPLWNATDVRHFGGTWLFYSGLGSTSFPPLFSPYCGLTFDSPTTSLIFSVVSTASSAAQATIPWSPIAGTTYNITVRYTSSTEGELGLPGNTISVFVNGVKGTDAIATSSALAAIMEPFDWSGVVPNAGWLNQALIPTPNGLIRAIESIGDALTDQEIAAWQ